MQLLFIPTFINFLDKDKRNVEICEKSEENKSGECMHTYRLHKSNKSKNDIKEIEEDLNSSQIAIREVPGGVHVITSLRFFNSKLKDFCQNDQKDELLQLYFDFFVKAILYLVNYYYYIKKEKSIHIEKSAFQTLLGFESVNGNFIRDFDKLKKSLSDIGILDYLFTFSNNGLEHYVFSESAFISMKTTEQFTYLKVSNIITISNISII
jgi:hypothetical protein